MTSNKNGIFKFYFYSFFLNQNDRLYQFIKQKKHYKSWRYYIYCFSYMCISKKKSHYL